MSRRSRRKRRPDHKQQLTQRGKLPGESRQDYFARLRAAQDAYQAQQRAAARSLDDYDHRQLRWMPYAEFLASEYWKRVRAKLRVARNFQCEECGHRDRLQVHHTTYSIRGHEHQHLDKLRVLCDACHRKAHGLPAK